MRTEADEETDRPEGARLQTFQHYNLGKFEFTAVMCQHYLEIWSVICFNRTI